MLSKNVVNDGITEYVDGIIILSGVSGTLGARTDVQPAERLAGRPAGRSSAARVSSAAPKKKAFDRGGPVWPPRSNAKDDRLRGGV